MGVGRLVSTSDYNASQGWVNSKAMIRVKCKPLLTAIDGGYSSMAFQGSMKDCFVLIFLRA
jgi:hypothetical protein